MNDLSSKSITRNISFMKMRQYMNHEKRINKIGRVFTSLYENSDIGNTHKKSNKKSLLDYSS